MSKISIVIDTLKPYADKTATVLSHGAKAFVDVVKNRDFQIGALTTGLITTVSFSIILIKYKKEIAKKERQYAETDELLKNTIAKQNAIIKELDAQNKEYEEFPGLNSELTKELKENQHKLRGYEKKMGELKSEIKDLKKELAELKKKAKDE